MRLIVFILLAAVFSSCSLQDKVVVHSQPVNQTLKTKIFVHFERENQIFEVKDWSLDSQSIKGASSEIDRNDVNRDYQDYRHGDFGHDEIHFSVRNGGLGKADATTQGLDLSRVQSVRVFGQEKQYWLTSKELGKMLDRPFYVHFREGQIICELKGARLDAKGVSGKLNQLTDTPPNFEKVNSKAWHIQAPGKQVQFADLDKTDWNISHQEYQTMNGNIPSYRKAIKTIVLANVVAILIAIPILDGTSGSLE